MSDPSVKVRILQDDSAHHYTIPVGQEEEFRDFVRRAEDGNTVPDEDARWATHRLHSSLSRFEFVLADEHQHVARSLEIVERDADRYSDALSKILSLVRSPDYGRRIADAATIDEIASAALCHGCRENYEVRLDGAHRHPDTGEVYTCDAQAEPTDAEAGE